MAVGDILFSFVYLVFEIHTYYNGNGKSFNYVGKVY